MAFKYNSNLLGENGKMLRKYVLDASLTFSVGDAMTVGADGEDAGMPGEIVNATTGQPILGIIIAIITNDGVAPSSDGAGGKFTDTYTTAASNETSGLISALVDVSPFSVYSVAGDDTLGTTTGSNKNGYLTKIPASVDTSNHLIDENVMASAADVNSTGEFLTHGLDPQDTTKVLVTIARSVLFAGSDSGE